MNSPNPGVLNLFSDYPPKNERPNLMGTPLTDHEKGMQAFLGCTKEQIQNADGFSYSSAKAEYEAWLRITGLGMLPHYSQELGEEFTEPSAQNGVRA